MKAVGIRELKNRLSEYLQMVRRGEEILVTDRGQVVAEIREPGRRLAGTPHPALAAFARGGGVRLGAQNHADLYPPLEPLLPPGVVERLLDLERGER